MPHWLSRRDEDRLIIGEDRNRDNSTKLLVSIGVKEDEQIHDNDRGKLVCGGGGKDELLQAVRARRSCLKCLIFYECDNIIKTTTIH